MVEFGSSNEKTDALVPGESEIAPRPLKKIEYQGFHGSKGEIVYRKEGGKVIFSALKGSDQATSTINAAEEIVKAICLAEGIEWRDPAFFDNFEFYDFTTLLGYPSRMSLEESRHAEILKLKIIPRPGKSNDIYVDAWTNVTDAIFEGANDFTSLFPQLPEGQSGVFPTN